MWNYIPEDILIEILLKVPAKSLKGVWSVCEAWQSLIRSPYLESLYLSNTETKLLVCAFNPWDYYYLFTKGEPLSIIKTIDLPNFPNYNGPISTSHSVKGSCNGLLCYSIQSFSHRLLIDIIMYVIIWNPFTGNHVILPQPPFTDPSEVNQVVLEFGVANNVYKVVRLVFTMKESPDYPGYPEVIVGSRAEIFTLGTTWRKLSGGGIDIVNRVRPKFDDYCWFFKGFMHWIVFVSMDSSVIRNSILTFHVGDEVFGEIKLPDELKIVKTLAVIGESFGLIDYRGKLKCYVWIMKDYGVIESWTKLYMIDCNVGGGVRSVVGFLDNSDLVLLCMDDLRLVIYNAKTKESKPAGDAGDFGNNRYSRNTYSWHIDNYKESLVLPEGCI